jgi:hypothetical protein
MRLIDDCDYAAAKCPYCQAVRKADQPAWAQLERERVRRRDWMRFALALIIAGGLCAILVLTARSATPKRHASVYVYDRGKPIMPLERSQKIARELVVPAAGGHAGYQQAVVIVDLLTTDLRPDRILWPHAAGVDTAWFGEIPEPAAGERSYAVVGRVGREVPDSVRVVNAEGTMSIAVRRKR